MYTDSAGSGETVRIIGAQHASRTLASNTLDEHCTVFIHVLMLVGNATLPTMQDRRDGFLLFLVFFIW